MKQTSTIPNIQDYVVVKYDNHWIGLIIAVESISIRAKIKFMAPHGLRRNFFWPQRDGICWVLNESILKVLAPMSSTSQLGWTNKLDAVDFKAICKVV